MRGMQGGQVRGGCKARWAVQGMLRQFALILLRQVPATGVAASKAFEKTVSSVDKPLDMHACQCAASASAPACCHIMCCLQPVCPAAVCVCLLWPQVLWCCLSGSPLGAAQACV